MPRGNTNAANTKITPKMIRQYSISEDSQSLKKVKIMAPTDGPIMECTPPMMFINRGSTDLVQWAAMGEMTIWKGANMAPANPATEPAMTKTASL